ncbi:hypothetical protein JMJ76_0006844 [Colletotrichum scovillei]|nr:hypothetical protein JMJ78_0013034 [Colletotrichum scovillei]KAG7063795.1 hypothetical protein JMJ76_0006844 [Colletotrichum scovillei]
MSLNMPGVLAESREAEQSSENFQSRLRKRELSGCSPGSPQQPPPKRLRTEEPKKEESPLLRLPPELRNKIYSIAFTRSTVTVTAKVVYGYVRGRSGFRWKRKNVRHHDSWIKAQSLPVTFLGTCKQVHAEARAILYDNCFDVQDMETLVVWLEGLGTNTACLRTIVLQTEPQRWLPSSDPSRCRTQPTRYRELCRRAARLLAAAEDLQALRTQYFYNLTSMNAGPATRAALKRHGPVSGWIGIARRVAEVLYHDFRSVYSKGLSRDHSPERLCRVLQVSRNNWWCYRHASIPRKLNAKEAREAEEEVIEHLRLLLRRNLESRLGHRT